MAQGALSANPGLMQQMGAGQTSISPEQAQRIQAALKAQQKQGQKAQAQRAE